MLEREIEALNSKLSDKGIRAMILRKKGRQGSHICFPSGGADERF